MIYGSGNYRYEVEEGWGSEVKQRWNVKECAGITIDEEDRIYLLTRTVPPVVILSKDGKVLDYFGEDIFVRAHGMYRDKDGTIYGVDDAGHAVYQFDADHHLIRTWGTKGVPSDTGAIGKDYKTIKRAAGPFNYPTRLVTDSDGNVYITDGYGNARVHKFTHEGQLIKSWGEPGDEPGHFNLPHGIAIDKDGILYVADRQNHRVQLFDTEGNLIAVWNGFHRPSDVWIDKNDIIYVSECKRTSDWNDAPSRISILDRTGHLLSRLEDPDSQYDPEIGSRCAHGMCVDSQGNLYVTEVGKKLNDSFFGLKKYRKI